ncbi:hypothetical protein Emag_006028 [Eimeria magna]
MSPPTEGGGDEEKRVKRHRHAQREREGVPHRRLIDVLQQSPGCRHDYVEFSNSLCLGLHVFASNQTPDGHFMISARPSLTKGQQLTQLTAAAAAAARAAAAMLTAAATQQQQQTLEEQHQQQQYIQPQRQQHRRPPASATWVTASAAA